MYSTCNTGKSVVAERFIRTLKTIFKQMTAVSKNVYFDILFLINTITQFIEALKWNQSDSYAEYNKDSYVTKPKFKVGYHVRISKYKNVFAKG